MKKQGFPTLLILMMLITPIASAFDHCIGMDMSGHMPESQNFSVTSSTVTSSTDASDNTIPLDHQKMLKESLNIQTDMDCDNSGNCTVHLCGGYGITSSVPTIITVISSYQSSFGHTPLYSTVLSSELRPPIFIL